MRTIILGCRLYFVSGKGRRYNGYQYGNKLTESSTRYFKPHGYEEEEFVKKNPKQYYDGWKPYYGHTSGSRKVIKPEASFTYSLQEFEIFLCRKSLKL